MSQSFDWNNLAFGSKKPLNSLKATFIAAPRELSVARFTQLIKTYLPMGNIVLGLAKEPYILGFEDQPQFKTLKLQTVASLVDKVNSSTNKHKIYILNYFQRDLKYLLEKLTFQRVVLINGSWKHTFHTTEAYYTLVNAGIPYQLISPFTDEDEAKTYNKTAEKLALKTASLPVKGTFSEEQMLNMAQQSAKLSFDYNFQTGAVLGKKNKTGYQLINSSFNKVVPYQTYALHHGASREVNFSPPYDLNHYDTVHAEVGIIINSQKQKINLKGTTLFVNLMPCPSCARMLSQTDIQQVIYSLDHSGSYAVKLLQAADKSVKQLI